MAPVFGSPPAPPAAQPPAEDAGRRGKPKRRRFNFNVLENLEKMVQTRSEPLPPVGWQPPAGAPANPAPPSGALPELKIVPPLVPPVEAVSLVKELPVEAPSLPLSFGPAQDAPKATEPQGAATETEEPQVAEEADQTVAASDDQASSAADVEEPTAHAEAEAPMAEVEAEPEPEVTTTPSPEPRKSMREMLFGEEASGPAESEPSAASEPEPAASSADWTWRPTRWEPAEAGEPTPDKDVIGATEPAAEQPVAEEAPVGEEAAEPSAVSPVDEPEPFAPWKSSFAPEAVTESEPANADAEEAPAVGLPESPAADSGDGGAGTIVIIEDDEAAASYYATLFRGNGYRVEVANDGVSGVDLCTRVQPQVILLDVMMPRQNGILVLQTLRASDETRNTPVVVMSNFSEPTLIKRAIQLGALEYVIKTQVEGAALLNAMPRWINREKAFAAA